MAKPTNRAAVALLILFALPFAGGGTFVAYLAGSMLVNWGRAQSWVETPTNLLQVDLDVRHGDDSTTYRVDAAYEYRYLGTTYVSNRVTFGFGADNIGSFHQDKHRELRAYLDSGRRFRCFVNPDDPAEAVLYRELRWGLLGLMAIFALVFAGVGYGLMFAAVYGGRRQTAAEQLKESRPGQPWLWRDDWAAGRIEAGSKGTMIGALLFATLWNLISAPVFFFVPEEVAAGNRLALLALLFPLVGAGLLVWAVYAVLQFRKFGNSIFEMHTTPGVLGGFLEGLVHTSIRSMPAGGFRLTLSCLRRVTSGSGDNRSTREEVLWQDASVVPGAGLLSGPQGASVPVRFAIPYDAGPQSDPEASSPVEWRLEAAADLTGVDFGTRFEVPVFRTPDSDPDLQAPAEATPIGDDPPLDETISAAGIVREPLPGGGVAYRFGRARSKGAAVGLTLFTAIWLGFIWLMIELSAPLFFPIVFGLFAVLLVLALFDMWLTETRIEVGNGTLRFTKRMIASGKKLAFRSDEVASIKPKRGMQAGNKLYYRIELTTRAGKSHILASQIRDQRLAKRLIADVQAAMVP